MKFLLAITLFTASLLSACSTTQEKNLGTAISTPLTDLNVVRAPIPMLLQEAQKAPYALLPAVDGAANSCETLQQTIHLFDEVLGADLDTPVTEKNPSLLERGVDAGGNAAVGAVRRTFENIIPYRGWIRQLTGAERHSRQVAAAITAGAARRAFLKGLMAGKSCKVVDY